MKTDLVVIGGGITGLSIAYIAAKAGKKVTVLEAGSRFGGLLDTFEIGGTRLEKFYHHFFLHDKEMAWLLKELGLEDEVVFKQTTMGILRNGKIFEFDTGLDLLKFKPIGIIDKIRFGLTSVYLGQFCDWREYEHISALSWFQKWCGKSATAAIWEPLLRVKFGAHFDKVPLAWMIGRLKQRMNSRKSGKEQLGYLAGSLGVLCDRLVEKLTKLNVDLRSNSPVEGLAIADNQITEVKTSTGSFRAEQVISTVPNGVLASLVQNTNPEFAARLNEVEYFGAVCAILEMKKPLSPVYWLNIADADYPFGGIIEQTNFIDSDSYNGIYVSYLSRYFTSDEPIAKMNDQQLETHLLDGVKRAFPDFSDSQLKRVHIFKTQTAATVCNLNFSSKVVEAKSTIDNLVVANMMHIYPDERSVNNSIRVAANVCSSLGVNTDYIPKGGSLAGQIGI